MSVWEFILEKLNARQNLVLLFVLESKGSSPGRKGFKMAVAKDGIYGTIGGGIMEHKLVEKAKAMLQQGSQTVLLMKQYHDKEHTNDRSGMICSGSQLNVFIPLSVKDQFTIERVISEQTNTIQLSPGGLKITGEPAEGLRYNTDTDWIYSEPVNQQPVIHIIGGGHIGLALSELMHYLGFYIKLYDDRPGLNTIAANSFAQEKHIINYESAGEYFKGIENDFAVILTVGYRTDKIVLKQLVHKPFFYLGLLGSDHKINMLLSELEAEGIDTHLLQNIHTPIGINIFSKTAREIAVSIAAEIIREKNKELPTGRQGQVRC
ncbi:MAG TPA: XdhC family protein [Ferruginibacter sp.]|nr:XdhC family protein [Ferruginibacter sp.]